MEPDILLSLQLPQHLFITRMVIEPREGATIRLRIKQPKDWRVADRDLPASFFRHVSLYEFHPDYDERLKFRGFAYVPPQRDLLGNGNFTMCGEGFLEEPYMRVRETACHEDDVRAITHWCTYANDSRPLLLRVCPTPFPMFKKHQRVRVVSVNNPDLATSYADPTALLGATAICTSASSPGAMTSIRFDNAAFNCGFREVGFWSLDLREEETA
ncbi:MAG TPA: hypothetical protein VNE61_08665 [Ktedonobacteraceae bacterium]|nr:hypothetical protein [Ktedonobacteraceae bacterium]